MYIYSKLTLIHEFVTTFNNHFLVKKTIKELQLNQTGTRKVYSGGDRK